MTPVLYRDGGRQHHRIRRDDTAGAHHRLKGPGGGTVEEGDCPLAVRRGHTLQYYTMTISLNRIFVAGRHTGDGCCHCHPEGGSRGKYMDREGSPVRDPQTETRHLLMRQ